MKLHPEQRSSKPVPRSGRRKNQGGFSLLLIAAGGSVMIGMLGLAFDLGRMFIVKNELQTFVDASAIAACRQLDGSQLGV
ncbi:MAG TPA: Tad domain-containing protein, partial [Bryobacteraceae bacterium]|nr:Tad domain-containing protein [Bryobacteraceae bacterium]